MIKGCELAARLGCDWQSDDPLIIPEVWDVASARILVEAGFPTLTTSAAAYAWAQGYRPGERVGLEELLVVAGRIIRDCQKPIIADLEGCFDRSNQYIKRGVMAALTIGGKGVILGDGGRDGMHQMLGVMEVANRIKSARMAAIEVKKELVLIARTDAVHMGALVANPFEEAIKRANTFLDAGADLVHVPGVQNIDVVHQLKTQIHGPVMITVSHGNAPLLTDYREAGITAVSLGTGLMRSALSDMRRKAENLMATGQFGHLDEAMSENDMSDILCEKVGALTKVASI
ncbi:MAG: isocitrate lyase/phosphoenolpyruvate mutase family protein [Hyphomicrobiales bacterium]